MYSIYIYIHVYVYHFLLIYESFRYFSVYDLFNCYEGVIQSISYMYIYSNIYSMYIYYIYSIYIYSVCVCVYIYIYIHVYVYHFLLIYESLRCFSVYDLFNCYEGVIQSISYTTNWYVSEAVSQLLNQSFV